MKADRQAPIGVFDSGVGGLTVVREIMRNLPDERIVYFGDTARVPYGSKSKNTVIRYSRQIVHFLETQQVKAIVIACNTASALALDTIEKEIDLPIIGVVKPGAQMAVETTQNKRVGVIATESTIQSGLYQQLITEADPAITVYGKPCPLFVPLVEEGWTKDPITEEVARRYLAEILDKDIDTLIMGCTHYPLLRSLLRKVVGEKVTLVNPAYETSQALRRLLRELDLENPGNDELGRQKYQFFASDGVERFNAFAHSVLPEQISDTKQVQIENYKKRHTEKREEHQKWMEKDVLISIRGLQYLMDEESGEQEPVEVMTTGSYYKKNGHHFLIYDEATEGFDMMTHNMIKFTENALEVRKRGLIDVHMIFEEDKKNISFYHTPYGMINMGVAATKVRMKETPDQILLKAEYALDINDSYVGDCVIDIEVRPREGGKLNL